MVTISVLFDLSKAFDDSPTISGLSFDSLNKIVVNVYEIKFLDEVKNLDCALIVV